MRRVQEAYANAPAGGHRVQQTVKETEHASQPPAGEYVAMPI